MQQTTSVGSANSESVGNPLGVFWDSTDPSVAGTYNNTLELSWYWSTTNAAAIANGAVVTVTVFADPDFNAGTATQLGEKAVVLTGLSPSPAIEVSDVPVKGVVRHEMLVQVTSQDPTTGEGLTVSYDSTQTPSGFANIETPPPGGPHVVFANDNAPTFAPATLASATFMAGEPQTTVERPVPGSPAPPAVDPNRVFVDWPLSSRTQTSQLSRSTDGGDRFRLLLDLTACPQRNRPNCSTRPVPPVSGRIASPAAVATPRRR